MTAALTRLRPTCDSRAKETEPTSFDTLGRMEQRCLDFFACKQGLNRGYTRVKQGWRPCITRLQTHSNPCCIAKQSQTSPLVWSNRGQDRCDVTAFP